MSGGDSLNQLDALTEFVVSVESPINERTEVTVMELSLAESLLTPGLQTSVKVHSEIHTTEKNFDKFKGAQLDAIITKPIMKNFGLQDTMTVSQTVYRLSDRKFVNYGVESFTLHACDKTLLNDARSLVSKSWKCISPSSVVSEVLRSCAGVTRLDIEQSLPPRDYVAQNIHPFKVVLDQADAALANGNDPSFVHYMTYENLGTHHFRSLYSLSRAAPVMEYAFSETGKLAGLANPHAIITYEFPSDFDLLSDALNGIGSDGRSYNTVGAINPHSYSASVFGGSVTGCGIGTGNYIPVFTNLGTHTQTDSCPVNTENWLALRQARMGLLEQDKVALRMTVPWNPELMVGKVVRVKLFNRQKVGLYNYGSGDYLISSLIHNIKRGGMATTTLDCVSETVGRGEV